MVDARPASRAGSTAPITAGCGASTACSRRAGSARISRRATLRQAEAEGAAAATPGAASSGTAWTRGRPVARWSILDPIPRCLQEPPMETVVRVVWRKIDGQHQLEVLDRQFQRELSSAAPPIRRCADDRRGLSQHRLRDVPERPQPHDRAGPALDARRSTRTRSSRSGRCMLREWGLDPADFAGRAREGRIALQRQQARAGAGARLSPYRAAERRRADRLFPPHAVPQRDDHRHAATACTSSAPSRTRPIPNSARSTIGISRPGSPGQDGGRDRHTACARSRRPSSSMPCGYRRGGHDRRRFRRSGSERRGGAAAAASTRAAIGSLSERAGDPRAAASTRC